MEGYTLFTTFACFTSKIKAVFLSAINNFDDVCLFRHRWKIKFPTDGI